MYDPRKAMWGERGDITKEGNIAEAMQRTSMNDRRDEPEETLKLKKSQELNLWWKGVNKSEKGIKDRTERENAPFDCELAMLEEKGAMDSSVHSIKKVS